MFSPLSRKKKSGYRKTGYELYGNILAENIKMDKWKERCLKRFIPKCLSKGNFTLLFFLVFPKFLTMYNFK